MIFFINNFLISKSNICKIPLLTDLDYWLRVTSKYILKVLGIDLLFFYFENMSKCKRNCKREQTKSVIFSKNNLFPAFLDVPL